MIQVSGGASVDRPKLWYPWVREAAEIMHKASMVHSKYSKSQRAGDASGLPWIVGQLHQRSLSTGAAQDFSPGQWRLAKRFHVM